MTGERDSMTLNEVSLPAPEVVAGTNRLICEALGIPKRGHLTRKTLGLEPLSDAAALRLVKALFDQVVEGPRTVVKRG